MLGRPRMHRVLWFTVWSAALGTLVSLVLGLPAAYVLHRLDLPFARAVRALLLVPFVLPTVVVGVAFRELLGEAGPLGFLGLDGTAVAIIAGLAFFNVAVVIRAVGAAWESLDPRPGEAAAALGATPAQVFLTVTLPALRPAIVSAASVVFLFCATSFGSRADPRRAALLLGRDRDLPAHHPAARPPGRGRAVDRAAARGRPRCWSCPAGCAPSPDPTVAAAARPARAVRRRGDLPAVAATVAAAGAGRRPARHAGRRLAAGRRTAGAWRTTGSSPRPATTALLVVPVTDALVTSLRTAFDATWMSLLLGGLVAVGGDPALAQPRPSAGFAACSTACSCCRSGSPR